MSISMIIDFHIHMFQPKYTSNVGKPPDMKPATDGTVEGTKRQLLEWGISHAVVQHIAPKAGESRPVNEFAKELAKDGFYLQFGAFHPDDPPEYLRELKESGIFYGIKMHPYIQRFDIDDKKMYPAYEELSNLKLPVLFHTGRDPFNDKLKGAFPEKIVKIHKDFPDLIIIAAHLGALDMYDEAEKHIIGTDLYIDISDSVKFCDLKQYERIIKNHDPDKILFASDCPMGNPQEELSYLERLNLGSELMEKILYKNAKTLLGI